MPESPFSEMFLMRREGTFPYGEREEGGERETYSGVGLEQVLSFRINGVVVVVCSFFFFFLLLFCEKKKVGRFFYKGAAWSNFSIPFDSWGRPRILFTRAQ